MTYYGMSSFTCHAVHFSKWEPFNNQYWCPLCEKLRVGNHMNPARVITKGLTKILRNKKDDSETTT